jgi:hypothetical protein
MSVAPLDLSDHIIACETPLELLEFGLASALRQNFGHSHKLTSTPKNTNTNERFDPKERKTRSKR